jgi:hypothetical protein
MFTGVGVRSISGHAARTTMIYILGTGQRFPERKIFGGPTSYMGPEVVRQDARIRSCQMRDVHFW